MTIFKKSLQLRKAVEKLRGAGLDITEEAHPDIELLKDRQIWLEIYNVYIKYSNL
jgi:hypothetical protein